MTFSVYPYIWGNLGFHGLLDVARRNGMLVINAFKVGMVVSASIALSGTRKQMRTTIAEWKANGHDLVPARKRSLYWKISTNVAPEDWVDVQKSASILAWKTHFGYAKRRIPCD